jgi:glutamate-1-semialdehyde 2,1-aminomutase
MKNNFLKRLENAIPGGAHTYSKGKDQVPNNFPVILKKGFGAYVFDSNNNKFLDYGMGLRSVGVGYGNKEILDAAMKQAGLGNNLSKPSYVELKAAEKIIKLIDSAEMVKFTKNGSSALTAAVKLSRAYTNKKIVLVCKEHPFFSYDDWFIGSTVMKRGIPNNIHNLTKSFNYNDIESLKKVIKKFKNKIACLVLEPSTNTCPKIDGISEPCCGKKKCDRDFKKKNHFLKKVEKICKKEKIIFILDEMITGFRRNIKGAQYDFGIKPDLSTFGKAMGNGFSIAALVGKRKIMSLGSINKNDNKERVFLLSTTHGAEMSPLGAFLKNLDLYKKKKIVKKIWNYGSKLITEANKLVKEYSLNDYIFFLGPAYSPDFLCLDIDKKKSLEFKTLFIQEMANNGVLMNCISISYSHGDNELKITLNAIEKTLKIYKKALSEGINKYLSGDVIKPVFRRYN